MNTLMRSFWVPLLHPHLRALFINLNVTKQPDRLVLNLKTPFLINGSKTDMFPARMASSTNWKIRSEIPSGVKDHLEPKCFGFPVYVLSSACWVIKMAIFSVYVLNRAGGLIYHFDHHTPKSEIEKTFSYPLDITLRGDDKLEVIFGEGGGIKGIFSPVIC